MLLGGAFWIWDRQAHSLGQHVCSPQEIHLEKTGDWMVWNVREDFAATWQRGGKTYEEMAIKWRRF